MSFRPRPTVSNYSRSSRKRPPRELEKEVVTRAGRLQQCNLVIISDQIPKSCRGNLWERSLTRAFDYRQFKRSFTMVVVTRAGYLREWSQGELRLYGNYASCRRDVSLKICFVPNDRPDSGHFISVDTVNSLIAFTPRKRPLRKQQFCFSVKNCFKSSLISDHHSHFLRDRDHSLGQKFDIFFCFLFPVGDPSK